MKVENVEIMGLSSSIIASGYPMSVNLKEKEWEIENLDSWYKYGDFLMDFLEYQKVYDKYIGKNTPTSCSKCGSDKGVQKNSKVDMYVCSKHGHQLERYGEIFETSPKYVLYDDYAEVTIVGEKRKTTKVIVDHEDIPILFYAKNLNVEKYLRVDNKLFHRLILKDLGEDEDIDHINKNKLDNRKENLRICSRRENTMNCPLSKNNTSGIVGVSYGKDKKKWRAYITVDNKQINLGTFSSKEDAIISRLNAENEYFKQYAPQRHLFKDYGIEHEGGDVTQYKHLNLLKALNHVKRASNLSNTGRASGHNQYETGVVVNFDLTFTIKAWVEMERYTFVNFVSSQSTMHRILKFNIAEQCNHYVDGRIIQILEEKIRYYNMMVDNNYSPVAIAEQYLDILYNVPVGFELTARLTTNYRALKTVVSQRHNHRLPEWREFCNWVHTLPYFDELCMGD